MNWNSFALFRLFRGSSKPPVTLQIVNLPELGPKPEWKDIEGALRGAQEDVRGRFILHLLLYHLGDARAEHEEAPSAPAEFVAFQRGRAASVNAALGQLLALMRGTAARGVPNQIKEHFGWKAEEDRKITEQPRSHE